MLILYSHIFDLTYKHIVPTKSTPNALLAFVGTKEGWVATFFYKHSVPTKSTPNALLAFVQINAEYAFGIRRD